MSDDGGDAVGARAQLALGALARRLETASLLVPAGLTRSDGDARLTGLLDIAVVALDAAAASVAIHDAERDRLVFVAAAGPAGEGVVGLEIDAAAGIAGYAFTTGQPLAIADVASDARFDPTIAASTGYVPRSILATPVTDDQGTVGVLEVLDRRGEAGFSLRDLDLAGRLAREAASILRGGELDREAGALLRRTLAAVAHAGADADAPALDEPAIEWLVSEATLAGAGTDDPTWRLVDSLARLRDADPAGIELAADWIDVLVRHADRAARHDPRR